MRIVPTPAAVAVLADVRRHRHGTLVFSIGNGCCDSTAPFLFEDHEVASDAVVVGSVDGVPVWAPRLLAADDDAAPLSLDVDHDVVADSLSVETDLGVRFVLRHPDQTATCATPAAAAPHPGPGPEPPHPPRTPALPTVVVPDAVLRARRSYSR